MKNPKITHSSNIYGNYWRSFWQQIARMVPLKCHTKCHLSSIMEIKASVLATSLAEVFLHPHLQQYQNQKWSIYKELPCRPSSTDWMLLLLKIISTIQPKMEQKWYAREKEKKALDKKGLSAKEIYRHNNKTNKTNLHHNRIGNLLAKGFIGVSTKIGCKMRNSNNCL